MSIDLPASPWPLAERPARRSVARALYRAFTAPVRLFAAHDLFISYCRNDGSAYAEGLANHFAGKGISCFIDQWHGNPERRIPAQTLRAARWSNALVVLASREALQSPSVEAEIREFAAGVPGPIQVVVFPGIPVRAARWHGAVAGVQATTEDGGEEALAEGAPSDAVKLRIETSLTFWRRNRRIAWTAGLSAAVVGAALLASLLLGSRAARMTRLADAVELAIRAEDRLANDRSRTAEALQLGVQSLASAPTAWGESAVRKGLMLLPAFGGSVAVERQGRAAFGPGGVLAQWYTDSARSEAERRTVYRLALIDPVRGAFVRPPVEIPGVVRSVRFLAGGRGIAAGVSSEIYTPVDAVYWIARAGGPPRRLEVDASGAFAVDPGGGSVIVANGTVQRWTLGPVPAKTAEWALPGVRALAFAPDGSRVFALRGDRMVSLDPRDPGAPVMEIARVPGTGDAALLATEGHVVVVADSVRTWSLAAAKWDHAYEPGTGQAAVAGDRLALWSQAGATVWDLAAEGVDHYAGAIRAACETDRGLQAALMDVSVSADGRRAALACGDGTARVLSTTDGTLLAVAPAAGAVPRAVHLDGDGRGLTLYATTPELTGPRARIARWTVVNASSGRIGGGDAPPMALAFALDARGGSLAAVFATAPLAYTLAVYDPRTGRPLARADTTLRGWSFRMAFDAGRVALAHDGTVSLWRVDGSRIRLESALGVDGVLALQFGGSDAAHLAVSSSRGDSVEVAVLDRGPGGWRTRARFRAGSWSMPGRPDAIEFAPVAVSGAGWVASLADTGTPPGSVVTVRRGTGAPLTLTHPDAVTLLRFVASGQLLAATRSGEIWCWSFGGARPEPRLIGRHGSAVVALAEGGRRRVLAIDRDNVIRMWALDTSTRDIGLRGYMEFPINRFGIGNYDGVGARALGVSGERLVTVNQHARGLFADTWVIPREDRLPAVVGERLGTLAR